MAKYPYTIADDFIRGIAGYNDQGTKLSRADASQIISAIADALGANHEEMFIKIADAAQKYEAEGGHPIIRMNINHFLIKYAKEEE